MTVLQPVVVLLPDSFLPKLREAARRYRETAPASLVSGMDEYAVRYGWTDEMIVAGFELAWALDQNRDDTT